MFNDPLYLASVDPTDSGVQTALGTAAAPIGISADIANSVLRTVDISAGKSVRVSGNITVTIQHSTSNENRPIPTNRTLMRIDHKNVNADGVVSIASAYLVAVAPQGVSAQGSALVAALVRTLAATLLFGNRIDVSAGNTNENSDTTLLERLLQGEP